VNSSLLFKITGTQIKSPGTSIGTGTGSISELATIPLRKINFRFHEKKQKKTITINSGNGTGTGNDTGTATPYSCNLQQYQPKEKKN
jgi:hypothetical protein